MVKAYVDQFDSRFEVSVEDDSSQIATVSPLQYPNYEKLAVIGNIIWGSLSLRIP